MNPPLRSAKDREAILEGLADGTIEVLCSDHAPHCDFQKEVEFDYAPFVITGLETELALSLMQLVHSKRLSLQDMIAKYTTAPARILRLNRGSLSVGADADVTVFDPARIWTRQRRDTAIRLALGASASGVIAPLVAGGALLAVVGAVAGTVASLGIGPLVASLLFAIRPNEASSERGSSARPKRRPVALS
jgi:hypothetical protein